MRPPISPSSPTASSADSSSSPSASSTLATSSAYSSERCPSEAAHLEVRSKEENISSLSEELARANRQLLQYDLDNLSLRKENSRLKEKQLSLSLLGSRLESELEIAKTREKEMVFVINKLNDIVQNLDQEIAQLREQNCSYQRELKNTGCQNCTYNQNKNMRKTLFGWMTVDETSRGELRDSKLLETESKLSEQIEVNNQLKQYLEIMLLKICETT